MSNFLTKITAPCRFLLPLTLLLLTAHCLLLTPASGQTTNATLSGVVEDEKGSVIPGVKVTITNPATGLRRTVVTDGSGAYVIPLLPPATYTVMAEANGFRRVSFPDVILNVNDQRSMRIELQVGEVGAEVVVRPDEGVAIKMSPEVSTVIDRTFVQNMPLNGGSFSSLVLLTPGVTVTSATASDLGGFSVNGQRASTNYFTVDGVSANVGMETSVGAGPNQALGGGYPGTNAFGGTNNLVSTDALEEFKVQTSSYSAEFGRQPGAQVQVSTRSGKNQFGGSVFEKFRNEALDARGYFNKKPASQSPLRQNNFGGTFSGPLILPRFGDGGPRLYNGKDRTFFFFSYEGLRARVPRSGFFTVPSVRLRQVASAALQPILNAYPLPNEPEILTTTTCNPGTSDNRCDPATSRILSGSARYNFSLSDPTNSDSIGIRIDHTVNKKLFLFGRFSESPSERDAAGIIITNNAFSTRTLTIGATSIFNDGSSNELRFNYSRQQAGQSRSFSSAGGAVPIDSNLLTYGVTGGGSIGFSNQVGAFSTSFPGLLAGVLTDSYQRQLNFVDNLSLVRGRHNLKFGLDVRYLLPLSGPQDQIGVSFNSEDRIRSGVASNVNYNAQQAFRPRFSNYSVFAQDTWRPSKRLTLDLGVRWEVNPSPSEADGKMPPVVLGVVDTDVTGATLAPPGEQFYKTYWTALAPRVGAAYQIRANPGSETVLRAGFGVYYDLGSGTASGGWPFRAARFQTVPTAQCSMVFPLSAGCLVRPEITLVSNLPTTAILNAVNENLKLPYSLQWNVAVQQSVGKHQTLSASYVASAGRRLIATMLLNQRRPDPVTGVLGSRPNSNFANINSTYNGPTSDYHSMQVQYQSRLKRGLQTLVNYTWSHAIDEVSSDFQTFNPVLERADANFDVRHNLSGALHYDIPAFSNGRVVRSLLGGWSVDSILHVQSGQPVNLIAGTFVDAEGTSFSARPDLVPGVPIYLNDPTVPGGRLFNIAAFRSPAVCLPAGSPNCVDRVVRQGTLGRNALRALPVYQVDVALGRQFSLTEKIRLQLKGEVFNVFNHPNFGGYNFNLSFADSRNFGRPSLTLNQALGGLNQLYQLGGPRSIQLSARISF